MITSQNDPIKTRHFLIDILCQDDAESIRHYIRLMSYIYAYLSNIYDN